MKLSGRDDSWATSSRTRMKGRDVDKLIKVGHRSQIPTGEGRKFFLHGEEIGIFNLGEKIKAISNGCPHRGGPLSDGLVTGEEVICPMHGRKVNLTTGCVENESEKVKVYEVVLKDDDIYINITCQ